MEGQDLGSVSMPHGMEYLNVFSIEGKLQNAEIRRESQKQ